MTRKATIKPKAAGKAKAPPPPPSKPPARVRAQTEKGMARAKKQKKKDIDDDDSSNDSADDGDPSSKAVLVCSWKKDPTMSQKLLALIMEDKDIKRSLYPPCGPNASSTQGGGKPKVDAYWELTQLLIGDDERYKESILAAASDPKARLGYANKTKNRLSAYVKLTSHCGGPVEMSLQDGQDLAPLRHTDGPDWRGHRKRRCIPSVSPPDAYTRVAEICDKCPWYFEMRNLIGQRPNLKPTGLGNSQSAVATGVILQGTVSASEAGTQQEEEEEEEEDGTSSVLLHDGADSLGDSLGPTGVKRAFLEFDDDKSDFEDDGAGLGSGDDYVPTSPAAVEADDVVLGGDEVGERDEEKEGGKTTKKAVKANAHLKNPAKPSTSNPAQPAAPAAPKASKKAKIAEFGEIALSEEQTRQKSLDLALLRTRQQMQNAQIKGRIVERREEMKWEDRKARREERMLKLRMKEAKMRHAHELRMRAGGSDVMSSTSHAAGFFDTPSSFSSRSSDYAPPDFDNFALDAFAGNAAAGPSGLQDYVGDGFSFPGPGSPSGSRQE